MSIFILHFRIWLKEAASCLSLLLISFENKQVITMILCLESDMIDFW